MYTMLWIYSVTVLQLLRLQCYRVTVLQCEQPLIKLTIKLTQVEYHNICPLLTIVSLVQFTLQSSSPLAMFYIENRKTDGTLNNMQIVKLKNKLGTRQLPTAELLLSGTKAHLVGQIGKGVATISHMLSISRIYNCLFASSSTRRYTGLNVAFQHLNQSFKSIWVVW